jgi:uncharacterized protein (TIGR03435 family)
MVAATPPGVVGGSEPPGASETDAPPDIFQAIKDQLGLTLEAKKGPVELIVIDHIEKVPTEN